MRAVRSERTAPERALWRALRALGIKHRRNDHSLPGSPDASIPSRRLAVFVHGCFWHGCPRHYRAPKSNRAFWGAKLLGNRRRDARARRALNRLGWSAMSAWECRTGSLRRRLAACA